VGTIFYGEFDGRRRKRALVKLLANDRRTLFRPLFLMSSVTAALWRRFQNVNVGPVFIDSFHLDCYRFVTLLRRALGDIHGATACVFALLPTFSVASFLKSVSAVFLSASAASDLHRVLYNRRAISYRAFKVAVCRHRLASVDPIVETWRLLFSECACHCNVEGDAVILADSFEYR